MNSRTPYFQVRVEGEEISDWVAAVTVTEDDQQADALSLTIPDEYMVYADGIMEGSLVEVDMGYASSNEHALLMRAIITKIEVDYPQSGSPSLRIKGEDRSIQMGLTERRKKWKDMSVTEIVREIGARYAFADIVTELDPDPVIDKKPLHQDGKTDLAFLLDTARRYRAKCFVELNERNEEILYFIPERRVLSARRLDNFPLKYRMGSDSNLITFQPKFNSSYIDRLKEINDVDEDGEEFTSDEPPPTGEEPIVPDTGRLSLASSEDSRRVLALNAAGAVRREAFRTELAARRATAGQVNRDKQDIERSNVQMLSRRSGMAARGTTIGNIWLRAKSIAIASGLNERFNGEWYVHHVEHSISRQGFRTSFECLR